MKKILFYLMCVIIPVSVNAAPRRTATLQPSRTTFGRVATQSTTDTTTNNAIADVEQVADTQETDKSKTDETDTRRSTCLANNIGSRDTFVWAATNSNTSSYATMVEDTTNPDNNVCFALVKVQTNDSKVDLSDISGKYYPMGTRIKCGEWVERDMLKQKILDGKKSTRVWATVAGSVGGAGLGVGIMELGGNKALSAMGAKSVQGQKALQGDELFISQLKVMKKDNDSRYEKIIADLKKIKEGCDNDRIPECSNIDYARILTELDEK